MGRQRVGSYSFIAIIVGLLVGIATVLGQGVLPGNWNSLANSGTVWLIPAFFIGGLGTTRRRAMAGAAISLIGMVAGYYGYAKFVQHVPHSLYYIAVWSAAAVVGGVIFGLGGNLWRRERGGWHMAGSGLLGGLFVTEGLHILTHAGYGHMRAVGWTELAVGFVWILVLERSWPARFLSLAAMLPVVALGMIGYGLLNAVTS
ncbi:DUF6518 family protein [Paenibacillus glycinis]|uniref:DUF6518 family protein n=1 Tax=Paenibacillus glycinis TaxID=2697035 RepID=UPI001F1C827C|nr:DUF6518 family protein [Paenibacillus glycinis]